MSNNIQFESNAGKCVDTYNLAKCRDVTEFSDKTFCRSLGLSDIWEEFELYIAQTANTESTRTNDKLHTGSTVYSS